MCPAVVIIFLQLFLRLQIRQHAILDFCLLRSAVQLRRVDSYLFYLVKYSFTQKFFPNIIFRLVFGHDSHTWFSR